MPATSLDIRSFINNHVQNQYSLYKALSQRGENAGRTLPHISESIIQAYEADKDFDEAFEATADVAGLNATEKLFIGFVSPQKVKKWKKDYLQAHPEAVDEEPITLPSFTRHSHV